MKIDKDETIYIKTKIKCLDINDDQIKQIHIFVGVKNNNQE